jgi:formylglycine-generating enzyme required for sulfatase activity
MVHIPGGTFLMGSPEDEGDTDEHPQHQVTLSAYCIDRDEVTVKAYSVCVAAKHCKPPAHTESIDSSAAAVEQQSPFCNRDDRLDHPMNCVNWYEAHDYCAQKACPSGHCRLPTEAEWEYAARGSEGRKYPWGKSEPTEKLLNACGTECVKMMRRFNKEAKSMYIANDGWKTTAPVGTFRDSAQFGVHDMAGNVWEWILDWYDRYKDRTVVNPRGPTTATEKEERVVRGGGWDAENALRVRGANRDSLAPRRRKSTLGFRCAYGY